MDHKEVARLHHQGISTSEIARRLGVSRGAIQKSIKKLASSCSSRVAPNTEPVDRMLFVQAMKILETKIDKLLAATEYNSLLLAAILGKYASLLPEGPQSPGSNEEDNHFIQEYE